MVIFFVVLCGANEASEHLFGKVVFFFCIKVFFTDTDNSQDSRGRDGTISYSTAPLPPAYKH